MIRDVIKKWFVDNGLTKYDIGSWSNNYWGDSIGIMFLDDCVKLWRKPRSDRNDLLYLGVLYFSDPDLFAKLEELLGDS